MVSVISAGLWVLWQKLHNQKQHHSQSESAALNKLREEAEKAKEEIVQDMVCLNMMIDSCYHLSVI